MTSFATLFILCAKHDIIDVVIILRENKWKNLSITALIVVSILFLLFFNYYYIFVSPKMIEVKNVEKIVEVFESENNKSVEFYSRYFADKVYMSATDKNNLYVFDETGSLIYEIALDKIDDAKIQEIASSNFESYTIAFAKLDKKPVYVIESKEEDIFIDLETFEEVLRFRKGMSRD